MVVRTFNACLFLSLVQILFIEWVSAGDMAKPNAVVFLSDNHSSVYGSHGIETPHMAGLAAEGMTLELAFVTSPSCISDDRIDGVEANHSSPSAGIKRLLKELGYEVVAFGKVGTKPRLRIFGSISR